jgi:putative FmdB family regulatory protein
MPIYDFQCTSCGHQSELMRKMSEPNTTTCPHCNAEAFTKMLSAPSFQLNGTGWYATDFKSNNSKAVNDKANVNADTSTSETKAACAPGCACH